MPGPGSQACPKSEPRKKAKARGKRAEQKVEQSVRAACVLRDGDCRVGSILNRLFVLTFCRCGGESEWAHLGDQRRFKTRGQEPEARHTTTGSLMLCTEHHQDYDQHRLEIEPLTESGADGTLRFVKGGLSVLSIPKGTV